MKISRRQPTLTYENLKKTTDINVTLFYEKTLYLTWFFKYKNTENFKD